MASDAPKGPPPTTGPPLPPANIGGAFTPDSPVGGIVGLLGTLWTDINEGIVWAGRANYGQLLQQLEQFAGHWGTLVSLSADATWQRLTEFTVGQFYRGMLEIGLDVRVGDFDPDAKRGVQTVDTMLGFAMLLPWIVGSMEGAIKFLLGARAPHALFEALHELPEEMGLSWVLGTTIEEAFAAAVGASIEEGINEQKRPTRVEWPVLRQAWRQGLLHGDQLRDWLKKLGYPDDQIEFIVGLDLHQLSMADLSQLYLSGDMTPDEIKAYLKRQGYHDDDITGLLNINIYRAETSAGVAYRSIGRNLFTQQLITEDQYRHILELTHTPKLTIDEDIAGIRLEHEAGRIQAGVATLKSLYLHRQLDHAQAQHSLEQLGYSHDAIQNTIKAWDAGPVPHPLPAARILSYFVSGLLNRQEAEIRLRLTHLREADVQFLLNHPTAAAGVKPRQLTPNLVVQAFLAGAIDGGQLEEKLRHAGDSAEAAHATAQVALFRQSRQRHPAGETIPLTEGQVLDALALNLADPHSVLAELMHLGYSQDDAHLLMEIKLKGSDPFAAAPPARFASLDAAKAYLVALGYQIQPPPDPAIGDAEQMLWGAGYQVLPPPPKPIAPPVVPGLP